MPARVVILPTGSAQEIGWSTSDLLNGTTRFTDPAWTAITTSLVSAAADPQPIETDVFVCMVGDDISTPAEVRAEARPLLRQAREACWASPVYLVVSTQMREAPQIREGDPFFKWLAEISRERARDLLRISYDWKDASSIRPSDLRRACVDSGARRAIHTLAGNNAWRCLIRDRDTVLRTAPPPRLAQQDGGADWVDHRDSLVIPIDPSAPGWRQRRLVERAMFEYPDRDYLVASMRNDPASEVVNLCHVLRVPDPIRFSSEIELWYFLVRLNGSRFNRRIRPETTPADVTLVGAAPVQSFRQRPEPAVLITHSFPSGQASVCRDAAYDVGTILADMSPEMSYHVDIAVTPARLVTLLASLPDVNAWVHMGHGDPSGDLYAGDGSMVSPDRWLACFSGRDMALSLAVFLSCHSDDIARRFAMAGAQLAIGFDGPVVSESCRLLAREVFAQWLRAPSDLTISLAAFAKGSNAVFADAGGTAKAFVPRR